MAIAVHKLTGANVYLEDGSLLGQVAEVTLPGVKQHVEKHEGLGMVGAIELPDQVEEMKATLKWNAFYEDALARLGHPNRRSLLTFRGNLQKHSPRGLEAEVAAVAVLLVATSELKPDAVKMQGGMPLTDELSVHYYKLTVGGRELIEIDPWNSLYRVDGVDIRSDYRSNLGI